jgi:succinylglutamate desuccinylase
VSTLAQIETPLVVAGAHLIARFEGERPGPTIVAVAGIHGNEPAGTFAARRVASEIQRLRAPLAGTIVFLAGNTRALSCGVRYLEGDLNRQWTDQNVAAVRAGRGENVPELAELAELLEALDDAIGERPETAYVLDLHTTSADGVPFALVGDTLHNRAFAMHFPLPIILGLEEQLDGLLTEYASGLGATTLAIEGGQHAKASSADHHEAVLWIALVAAGCLRREDVPAFDRSLELLDRASGGTRFVEVIYRYAIDRDDGFRMRPGFTNFQPIARGQVLAEDRKGEIRSPHDGLVLLPLYQKLGDDGFFTARIVEDFWLRLSKALRKAQAWRLMRLLPGVRKYDGAQDTLEIDTRIARFFPLQVFHLLGYRKRRWDGDRLLVSRRKHDR